MLEFDGDRPLLVFGGPYSNLAATEAMQRRARLLGIWPDHVICTGDVVAYGAEPEETAAAVRDWGCHTIQGNCEQQLAVAADDCACAFEDGSECAALAKSWYPFANARVSAATRTWMGKLPPVLMLRFAGYTCRVIHGGVREVNRWVFTSQPDVLAEEAALAEVDIIMAGHTGLPFISRVGGAIWFNPGAIGLPANDGTTDVWYGLLRLEQARLILSTHRLAYDHHRAAAAMRRHGHANGYARTLVTGLWPSLDVFPPPERAAAGRRIRPRRLSLPLRAKPARLAQPATTAL